MNSSMKWVLTQARKILRYIKKLGFRGVLPIILIVVGGWFIFSLPQCEPWRSVAAVCLLAVGLFTLMEFILPTSWHIPSLLIIFLGLIFALWYNPYDKKFEKILSDISTANSKIEALEVAVKNNQSKKNVLPEKSPTSSPIVSPSDDKWTKGEFILTFFAFLTAIVALVFGKKIEKLFEMEAQLKDTSRLTISTAEIALANLPDFTESHQISYDSYKTLKIVDDIIFYPQSHILKFLDETGNGATLRFARAVKLFADGEYKSVIDELKEITMNQKTDIYTYSQALYRLGITYRQLDEWADSINTFCELYKYGDNRNKIKAQYGIALTLFAISKLSKFVDSDQRQINKCLSSISKDNVNTLNDYKALALKLINEVLTKHPFHFSAILFSVLIPASSSILPIRASDKSQKERLHILIRFLKQVIPESLNIRANYFVVESLANYSLGYTKKAKTALEYASHTTNTYKDIVSENQKPTIFSDIQIKQIPAEDFLEEIKKIKTEMDNPK